MGYPASVDSSTAGRVLLVLGIAVAVCGLVLVLGGRLPFGRLPGDLSGGGDRFSWSVPLGTSLVLSIVLTVVLNLVIRR